MNLRTINASLGLATLLTLVAHDAQATEYRADPSTFTAMLPMLRAGDSLVLAAGRYTRPLNVSNLNGTSLAPITITGPESGEAAVFVADPGACCNTIELRNSSYVTIRRLTVDGNHVSGVFGLSAKDGASNRVHHITVEDNLFQNHDGSQQTVAISTKTPTWGWIIRRNRILSAGTGMYLGNSDGSSPFVQGIIENNLIENPIGYCMQIKWQAPWPTVMDLPTAPTATILRDNVFIKNDRASPDGVRPNVLVGGLPASGAGAGNRYEIYRNLFVHNGAAGEGLLQASGRVSIHHNIFVDAAGHAILVRDHDRPLLRAWIYDNTIYGTAVGVRVGSAPEGIHLVANAIFSAMPVAGSPTSNTDNVTDSVANAAMHVNMPSLVLGTMDFYRKAGRLQGAASDHGRFNSDLDFDRDFNGDSASAFRHRGAYAGEGANPGWRLAAEIKRAISAPMGDAGAPTDASVIEDSGTGAPVADAAPVPADSATDAPTDGSSNGSDAAAGSDASDAGTTAPMPAGCACTAPAHPRGRASTALSIAALALGFVGARRRRHGSPRRR